MLYKKLSIFTLLLFSFSIVSCSSAGNKNSSSDSGFTTKGISSKHIITHDGYAREYISYIPANTDKNELAPLLLVLHGGGGTHEQIIQHTQSRFNQLADRDKFYVVYPQGLEKGWNDGRSDLKQFSSQNNIDDVGFIQALIHKFKSDYNIDENKVFVTGISNGGFMSFRLGCELRDEIRAIAPLTATISEEALKYCQGHSKVSLVLFNGTDDPLVPYEGGFVSLFGKKRGKITSTQQTIDHWLTMLNCRHQVSQQELTNIKKDGTTISKFEYRQCKSNAAVTLYRVNGGGHTWPGSKQHKRAFKRIVGNTSNDINACDEMWKFFSTL